MSHFRARMAKLLGVAAVLVSWLRAIGWTGYSFCTQPLLALYATMYGGGFQHRPSEILSGFARPGAGQPTI